MYITWCVSSMLFLSSTWPIFELLKMSAVNTSPPAENKKQF